MISLYSSTREYFRLEYYAISLTCSCSKCMKTLEAYFFNRNFLSIMNINKCTIDWRVVNNKYYYFLPLFVLANFMFNLLNALAKLFHSDTFQKLCRESCCYDLSRAWKCMIISGLLNINVFILVTVWASYKKSKLIKTES